jgi:hypothetical protein
MIRANNPEVDVDALMERVRTEAQRIRGGRPLGESSEVRREEEQRRASLVRRHALGNALREAEQQIRPRREFPRRLRFLARAAPLERFLLRVWNYAFKEQREKDASILRALRRTAETLEAEHRAFERAIDELQRSERELRAELAALREGSGAGDERR